MIVSDNGSYVAGTETDTLVVRANDGAQWSDFKVFTVTDTPPTVTAPNVTAGHGKTFAASTLVTASDGDGDTVTQYQFYDVGTGSGQLTLNGTPLATGQLLTLSAAQFAQTSYVASTSSDTLVVRANDGAQWSSPPAR